jgi:hypothetical protein
MTAQGMRDRVCVCINVGRTVGAMPSLVDASSSLMRLA